MTGIKDEDDGWLDELAEMRRKARNWDRAKEIYPTLEAENNKLREAFEFADKHVAKLFEDEWIALKERLGL